MENKISFASKVMLIDASYIDRVGTDLATYFTPVVKRELPKADLTILLECLALDAGVLPGNNEIQVFFVYDSDEKQMRFCTPSYLNKEIHEKAFKSELGEFSLYAFQSSEMVPRRDFFMELLQLLGESKDVKQVIVIPDEMNDVVSLEHIVEKIKGKESITLFGMAPPKKECVYTFEQLGFAMLQAFGIRADELG